MAVTEDLGTGFIMSGMVVPMWTQRVISGPSPRYAHAMAYDAANHVTVLFGGYRGGLVDDGTWTLDLSCAADFDHSGALNAQDVFDFLNAWFAGDPRTDFNGVNGLNSQDIVDFLNAWFAGC